MLAHNNKFDFYNKKLPQNQVIGRFKINGIEFNVNKFEDGGLFIKIQLLCLVVKMVRSINNAILMTLKLFKNEGEIADFFIGRDKKVDYLFTEELTKWCNINQWDNLQKIAQDYWAIAPNNFIPQPIPSDVMAKLKNHCRAKATEILANAPL